MSATTRAVLIVTVGNLLPLVFVATGSLDLPLLLVCYWVEALLLPREAGAALGDDLKLRVTVGGVGLVFLVRALFAVDWSATTLLVLAATVALTVAGTWQATRDPRAVTVGLTVGTALWRICLLLVGGVVALAYAEDLTTLLDHGWTPDPVGAYVSTYPAWAFNELVLALGLAPLTAAALVFVVFKTVNEGLWTALRGASYPTSAS
jgi:hypothetical protein